jgi:cation transport ATPase
MADLRLHVHEMDCAEEAALVRRALASHHAVTHVEFDLIHGTVDIVFDDSAITEAGVLAAVRSTGLAAHAVRAGEGAHADEPGHGAHDHSQGSSRSTVISGLLFGAGWIVEGMHAERWLDTFVHPDGGGHDPRAAVLYGLSALAGLWPMWRRAAAAVRHLRLDMHALVCLTVLGAAAIGEWSEGAAVAFLFAVAHRMEAWSIERARGEIAALVGRGPALVAEGMHHSAQMERFVERFASVYTPLVVAAAAIVAIVPPLVDGAWSTWFYRGLFFLVLACPCALVISTPVTMVAALSSAARRGVLVKGGAVLEKAAAARTPTRDGLAATGITVATSQSQRDRVAAADVVLTQADERAVAMLVTHARRAVRVVRQNVAVSLVTKLAFLASAPFGFAPLWMAVLADTGATVLVTMNGLRLLKVPRY